MFETNFIIYSILLEIFLKIKNKIVTIINYLIEVV